MCLKLSKPMNNRTHTNHSKMKLTKTPQKHGRMAPANAATWIFVLAALMLWQSGGLFAQSSAAGDPYVLISSEEHHFMNAHWSPDGQSIAFSADNHQGIWLADADGSNIRQLTADQGAGFGFSWSPCSHFILGRAATFRLWRRFNQVKIYDVETMEYDVLVKDTRVLRSLPLWTPGGSQVAMVLGDQLELKSSERLRSVESGPDAETGHIVYFREGKLISTDMETKTSREIASFDGRTVFNISVSPCGRKVAFQVGGRGLFVAALDGSEIKHLGYGERASWMPGGKYIVAGLVTDDGYTITGSDLYVVDTDTGVYYPLTEHTGLIAMNPSVSPCGKKVLFNNPGDGNIYVMAIE